jgi:iron complex transport system substrate-binding protein
VSNYNNNNKQSTETKIITDMRGKKIEIVSNPKRIVAIGRGFTLHTLIALDKQDKLVATGGALGRNPLNPHENSFLYPEILDLPNIGWAGYGAYDYEKLINSNPDVVIVKQMYYLGENENHNTLLNKLENDFKLPVVVINDPTVYENPSIDQYYEAIRIIGKIVNSELKANELIDTISGKIDEFSSKIPNTPDENNDVLFLGLRNDEDGVGLAYGKDFAYAKFSTKLLKINNVIEGYDSYLLSAEKIIEKDPNIIILVDSSVIAVIDKLLEIDSLRDVSAIKNRRVYSTGLLGWWGESSLNFATQLAIYTKIVYPNSFEDFSLIDWYNDYYKKLYHLNDEQLEKLRDIKEISWIKDY